MNFAKCSITPFLQNTSGQLRHHLLVQGILSPISILFINSHPLFRSSSSIFASFIFISVVQFMFFWAFILASSGLKLSFPNSFALSTNVCVVLYFCGNSISHRCLILFIKFYVSISLLCLFVLNLVFFVRPFSFVHDII